MSCGCCCDIADKQHRCNCSCSCVSARRALGDTLHEAISRRSRFHGGANVFFGEAASAAARRLLVGASVVKYCQVQTDENRPPSSIGKTQQASGETCSNAALVLPRLLNVTRRLACWRAAVAAAATGGCAERATCGARGATLRGVGVFCTPNAGLTTVIRPVFSACRRRRRGRLRGGGRAPSVR